MSKTSKMMFYSLNIYNIRVSILLGLSALLLNALPNITEPETVFFGNICIFISALILPPFYAAVTAILGLLPHVFISEINPICFIQAFILTVVISSFIKRNPKIPAYLIAIPLLCILIPAQYYLSRANFFAPLSPQGSALNLHNLLIAGYSDTLFVIIAGTLLLNNDIWNFLTKKPRNIRLSYLLYHTIPSGLLTASLLVIIVSGLESTASILSIFFFSIFISIALAKFLAKAIEDNSGSLITEKTFEHHRSTAFSGTSSEFWKRKSTSTGEIPFPSVLNTTTTSSTKNKSINSNTGVCAIDKNGVVLFLNRQFKELLHVTHPTPLGQPLAEIGIEEGARDDILQLVSRTIKSGSRKIEIKLNSLPEKLRFYEIRAEFSEDLQAISLSDNNDGVVIKVKEITNRRALESHMIRAQRLNSIGNIVRGMTHDFNNTLASIIGQASCGTWSTNKEEMLRYFESIITDCEAAGEDIRRLLDFVEEKESTIKAVNLGQLLKDHLDLFNRLVGEKIELVYNNNTSATTVSCDPQLTVQAIINILINSKEAFAGNKGKISINVSNEKIDGEIADLIPGGKAGTFCQLLIVDNAQGMNSEVLSKCCDALFTTKTSDGHSGLGLTMVYGIMRSFEGFLAIESNVNKGTSISLYFPQSKVCEMQVEEPLTTQKSQSLKVSPNKEKILVVDDDSSIRNVVSTMLSKLGYSVSICENGAEALAKLSKEKIDLLLTDLAMPGMTGVELVNELKAKNIPTKTIIMTAYNIDENQFDDTATLLSKPFDIETLSQVVHNSITT